MTKTEVRKANEIISDIDNLNIIIKIMENEVNGVSFVKELNDSSILHDWTEISVEFLNNKIKEKEEELKNMQKGDTYGIQAQILCCKED